MGAKSRTKMLLLNGIDIRLTKQGCDLLAKILSDGCPVKTHFSDFEPIKCPYNIATTTSLNCESCWKKWLSAFVEEE